MEQFSHLVIKPLGCNPGRFRLHCWLSSAAVNLRLPTCEHTNNRGGDAEHKGNGGEISGKRLHSDLKAACICGSSLSFRTGPWDG